MLDNKIIKIDEDLLTIPIYLNTKIVFDMVATIENGFAEVTNIQTTSGSSKENQIMANIGTENTFSLFNIGLRAERADANNQNRIETEERTHTPVSLLPFYICVSSEKSCAICTKGNCSTIS